ncbi:polysaccharide biosynthesis tyrosine autokinase [Ectothiorhodospira shaposhnikovii]|uniref:polysaccharide biosynthesis tyrosine autokinase n=1 Tax=Ectothiorhodospira shaposhnikovii TaxID=1054 RepID=UPI00399FCA04
MSVPTRQSYPADEPHQGTAGQSPHVQGMDDGDVIDLSQLLDIALRGKWQILGGLLAGALLGGFVSWQSLPSYESSALLQVELKHPGLALPLGPDFMPDLPGIATELEIIKSRMVLAPVVRELQLDIVASPVSLPLLGRPLSGDSPLLALPLLGDRLRHYAGLEARIAVSRLDFEGPWAARSVILEVREDQHFGLWTAEGDSLLAEGRTGDLLEVSMDNLTVTLRVMDLEAPVGARFLLSRRSELNAVTSLRGQLAVREMGRQTGLMTLSVQAASPEEAARRANAIAQSYQRQHVERRSEQARATLAFLDEQIPGLRREVERAEQALIDFMQSEGTTDLDRDASWVLNRLVELDTQLGELRATREELLLRLTVEHPRIQGLDRQIARLRQELRAAEREVSRLPVAQQTLLSLQREAKAATEIYVNLLNTAQELQIAQAGIVGSVRVIDSAVPMAIPVGRGSGSIITIAALLGLMLGAAAAFLLHAAGRRVHDPDRLEQDSGLPVFGVVPDSRLQRRLSQRARQGDPIPPLCLQDNEDPAVEAIRSLNTGLLMAAGPGTAQVLLLTGPSPGVGKSFLSINLGAIMAQSGARVLVIDADIRKQSLKPYLPADDHGLGLTDYLAGGYALDQVVQPLDVPGLEMMSAGHCVRGSYPLLMHAQFQRLLDEAVQRYDRIILDTPPALMFSDAATLSRGGMNTLVVLKSSDHKMAEVTETVKRMRRAGANVLGFVLNQYVPAGISQGYYGAYGYGYRRYYRSGYGRRSTSP